MTVVRPHLQWGVAELGDDGRVEGFVEKPRSEHWINGGFFCFEPGALDYLDEDSVLEREPLARLAADGAAARLPPRGLLGLHGHLQGRGRAQRPLGRAARRRGRVWTPSAERRGEAGAGHRRPRLRRLAPGAGAARARRRRSGARPARRRASPTSAASGSPASTCSGSAARSSWSRPTCATPRRSPRRSRACDSVFHLAAQTIVGVARDSPLETFEVNVRGAWNVLRGLPRARGRAGRLRLLRQGLRLEPGAALPRGLPAARRLPLRRQQGGGRHRSPAATRTPTGCRSRSPASPTSTAAATSTSRA